MRVSNIRLLGTSGRLVCYITRSQAAELVSDGSADALSHTVLRLYRDIPKDFSQGAIYEKAGIEKNRQYVDGGLTRTEHKPAVKPYPVRFP